MLLSEILEVKKDLFRLTYPGGTLICSGILKRQESVLIEAICKAGFNFCSSIESQKWSAVSFERI